MAILCAMCFIFADELPSGTSARIGMNIAHLTQNAGQSRNDSAHAAIYADMHYIFRNGFVLGADATFGASVGNTNKHYTLQGEETLTQTIPRASSNLINDSEIYVGYYFIRRKNDKPLYIGTGYKTTDYFNSSLNAPFVAEPISSYIPIELRGDVALRHKWILEYLFAYDIGLNTRVSVVETYQADIASKVPIKRGYGLRLSAGVRYYISKNTYFYTNIIFWYRKQGASDMISVNVPADSDVPGVIQGASANVFYPASHANYVGLRFGLGF